MPLKSPEERKEYQRKYYQMHKYKLLKDAEEYRNRIGKEVKRNYNSNYYVNNKEEMTIYHKKYNETHSEERKEYQRNYRETHKEKIKLNNKEYRETHKDIIREVKNRRKKERLKTDSQYKLRCNMSSLIYHSIKDQGFSKNSKTAEYLNADWPTVKEHIEKQFTEGMSWDNMGLWHLDHIEPISRAITEEDLFRLNHYTNFQPLWAKDNLRKSNTYINNII